jgi:multimeric flavodoxin WrbA
MGTIIARPSRKEESLLMKAVCLLGSPRKGGNSAAVAGWMTDRIVELGGEVETFYLNGLRYRGCQGCYACKRESAVCVVKDDLAEVLDRAAAADALILATPVYFGDVSAQLKGFVDRTFSWLVPDYPFVEWKSRLAPGRKLAVVLTQAHPDETRFDDVFPRYAEFFGWLGFPEARLVRGWGLQERSNPATRDRLVAAARETAEWLAGAPGR